MDPNADPNDIPDFRIPRKPLTAYQIWQLHKERRELHKAHLDRWEATISETGTGRPIDAIICPPAPYTAVPHGQTRCVRLEEYIQYSSGNLNPHRSSIYTVIWNALDCPSLIIPVTKVDPQVDVAPTREEFWSSEDKLIHGLCRFISRLHTVSACIDILFRRPGVVQRSPCWSPDRWFHPPGGGSSGYRGSDRGSIEESLNVRAYSMYFKVTKQAVSSHVSKMNLRQPWSE